MNNNWKYLETNRQVIDRIEKQIHEASSVLKYSLYLKPIEITTTKEVFSNSLIEDANNKTFENLKTFTEDKRYDIFGYREINKKMVYQAFHGRLHSGNTFLNNMLFFLLMTD